MAFWKKSEDPWDIDPDKRNRRETSVFEAKPAEETLTERRMFGKKAVEKAPAEEPQPVPCPWCGEPMTRGYLTSGRDAVVFSAQKPTPVLGTTFLDTILISDEGFMPSYKVVQHCAACRKLVVDVPPPAEPNYVWDGGTVRFPDEEEEECHDL